MIDKVYIVVISNDWEPNTAEHLVFKTKEEAIHGAAEHARAWSDEDIEGDDGTPATDELVINDFFGENEGSFLEIIERDVS